ncbi:MAG: glycosyltransferase family 2 protein [Prevotella sp.]|nr:glycosyltransferase family 2 protein [Prevotella sp.]
MKQAVSILIPTYNDDCRQLAASLQQQAEHISGLEYEILIADDGSTDMNVVNNNATIGALSHCTYLRNEQNKGRSFIRNFLAQNASYPWLLFIDGDMKIRNDQFLGRYLETLSPLSSPPLWGGLEGFEVVYGGYSITIGVNADRQGNLRYRYEKRCEGNHSAENRRKAPYKDFHTSNFMVSRDVMLRHPLDERFRHYGYEDVLWGKTLQQNHIPIHHIDNPVSFEDFEDNSSFVSKTEEGLRTLKQFSTQLEDYSRLIPVVRKLGILRQPVKWLYKLLCPVLRSHLCSNNPSLKVFNFYRLGYYLSL